MLRQHDSQARMMPAGAKSLGGLAQTKISGDRKAGDRDGRQHALHAGSLEVTVRRNPEAALSTMMGQTLKINCTSWYWVGAESWQSTLEMMAKFPD